MQTKRQEFKEGDLIKHVKDYDNHEVLEVLETTVMVMKGFANVPEKVVNYKIQNTRTGEQMVLQGQPPIITGWQKVG